VEISGALLVDRWEAPIESALGVDGEFLTCGRYDLIDGVPEAEPWGAGPTRTISANPRMFDDFLRLGQAHPPGRAPEWPDRVVAFARRWGVLGLCEHGLPASHRSYHRLLQTYLAMADGRWLDPARHKALLDSDLRVLEALEGSERHLDLEACEPLACESLLAGWVFASQARAVAAAATMLRDNRPCDDEIQAVRSLRPAFRWSEPPLPPPIAAGGQRITIPGTDTTFVTPPKTQRTTFEAQRSFIALVVQEWLEFADLALSVEWQPIGPMKIRYSSGGLFSAVAVSLALSVSGAKGIWLCCHCGNPYSDRKRAPQKGKLHYCSACKSAGPQKAWRNPSPK
jgi:hypothetical protein